MHLIRLVMLAMTYDDRPITNSTSLAVVNVQIDIGASENFPMQTNNSRVAGKTV